MLTGPPSPLSYTLAILTLGDKTLFCLLFELTISEILENHYNIEKSYKLIRSSDENTLYMKVAQNNETNLDTQPVCPPHISNISNSQTFPSGSFVRKRETPGILSR